MVRLIKANEVTDLSRPISGHIDDKRLIPISVKVRI